ncbi:hypothetical protein [Pseudoxanthomonas sp. UTMC 1351]|uniref:hypothetical protein n=1 Tax=Pseudoxanthomonas sp. UTMC 1351 TaxID=2695853 RepID=UPI0034CEC50B
MQRCYPILMPFKFAGVVVKPGAFVPLDDDQVGEYFAAGVIGLNSIEAPLDEGEAARLRAEEVEAARIAEEQAQRAEADRMAAEQAATDRIATDAAEADRIAQEHAQRVEADRIAAEQAAAAQTVADQAAAKVVELAKAAGKSPKSKTR